jgi:site-specific DNA-methyltransferase (adenine-specific)
MNVKLITGDCVEKMKALDTKVNIVITSPPYNVNLGNNKYKKDGYNVTDDNLPYNEYLDWMKEVFTVCFDVLTEDGRICINIGDGKNGAIPTHSDFIQILKDIGFIPLTTIIWNKNTMSSRTAWGSFMSASAPSFPRGIEYILVFGKTPKLLSKGESTMTKEEFIEYSNGLWVFHPEKKQKEYGHPAMFPVELPERLIKMLTYKDATVLDPFSGTATTGVACYKTGRNYIGIEKDPIY